MMARAPGQLIDRINGLGRTTNADFRPVNLAGKYTTPDGSDHMFVSAVSGDFRIRRARQGDKRDQAPVQASDHQHGQRLGRCMDPKVKAKPGAQAQEQLTAGISAQLLRTGHHQSGFVGRHHRQGMVAES
jgi:hypothetical protein